MKKNLLKKSLAQVSLLLFVVIAFFACQKEPSDSIPGIPTTPGTTIDLATKVKASSISGFVTDETNAVVANAAIKIGAAVVNTDKYGFFEVRNEEVVKNAATITVTKSGYFNAIKTYMAEAGKSAFFRIKLISKTTAGSFTAADGGTITTPTGLKIVFPANAIVNATNGNAYTGTVSVAAYWINPAGADLNQLMPGDLRGIDKNNNAKLLTTYGMVAAELTTPGGELLQVAPGKKATVSMPIPASLTGTAPASLPLWHFDETTGLWKEEGTANKIGTEYVGEVSHFSFWNCDVPNDYVQVSCTLKTTNGSPLPFAVVKISLVNTPRTAAYGYTDSSGYVSGAVPPNAQLKLEVFTDYSCATPVFSHLFATTNSNAALGTITVDPPATTVAAVSGTVKNCNGLPVTNGYLMMNVNHLNYRYKLSNTGTYSFTHLLCAGPEMVDFIGEDVDALQQSTTLTQTVTYGSNIIPDLQACGLSTNQFINYSAKGVTKTLTFPTDSFSVSNYGQYDIWVNNRVNYLDNFIRIRFNTTGIGVNSKQQLDTAAFYSTLTLQGYFILPLSPIMVNITEYGSVGQFISGNFTCTLNERNPTDPPGTPPGPAFTFTCNFRVKRF